MEKGDRVRKKHPVQFHSDPLALGKKGPLTGLVHSCKIFHQVVYEYHHCIVPYFLQHWARYAQNFDFRTAKFNKSHTCRRLLTYISKVMVINYLVI